MFHVSSPRWTRRIAGMLWSLAALTTSSALAGNTHTEGGAVSEAPGVPETDGTATVQIYWPGDSAARTSVTSGVTLAGYWLHDVGFALGRQWLVGDEHIAILERQTGAGTMAHAGYYGVSTKNLTSLDPDQFGAMTVRPVPVPLATAGPGAIDLAWNKARAQGSATAIAGYDLYRGTDGIAFTKLNAASLADTTYHDATPVFGTTYYYAVAIVYGGTPNLPSSILSANSAAVSPLDATPPDMPEMIAEPGFSPGTANMLAWSSEAASGATAYYAECALDAAFTSLVGNSGWIAATNFQFTGLADGRTYYYRVRARDAATNVSDFSAAVASRQDASAPASHLLALGAFKASSTVNLEWTATDSLSGVSSVALFYAKDGAGYTLYPAGPFTTTPIAFDASTTGGDGSYAFYTVASDAVANAETAPETADATTIVDTQAPAAPAFAALPQFTAGAARLLAWSSMATMGASSYRIQASETDDFATLTGDSDWMTDSTYTFTGLADGGRYAYRVESRDDAGNESDWSGLVSSTMDASAPATAVDAMPAFANHPNLSIAWTGSDAGSGLAAVDLYWSKNGGAFAALEGGPFAASPIAFDAAAHGGDGSYAFYTLGTDAVANAEQAPASADASILIDTVAPAAPQIAALPGFSAGNERSISWTGGDATSFFAQAATDAGFTNLYSESGWSTDASFAFTGLADGTPYFYRVKGRDAAGNESSFSAASMSVQDATAPSTAASALPAISSSSSFEIAWSGSDAVSGLAGADLWFSKDGGPFTLRTGSPFAASPIAFDTTPSGGDGTYRFYTRGHDAVGNFEEAPADADAQTIVDTSAPGAPAIAGLQTFTAGTSLHLVWSDESASGAAAYLAEMSANPGFSSIDATSGWTPALAYDFMGLTDGTKYYFRVKARDAANNETGFSGAQSTTMDATAPEAAIAALPASTNDPTFELAWSGSDAASGILNVDLYISKDGAPYALASGGPFDASPIAFDATSLGDGMYSFFVRGRDRAGNVEASPPSADATTQLDTGSPGAPEIAVLPAFTAGTSCLTSWTDLAGAGATEYLAQASTDAGFASIALDTGWMSAVSYEFTGLNDGQIYYYRAKSRDALGNESAFGATRASTQDASAPATQIATLPASTTSMHVGLAWSGSDATSGLQGADLYYAKNGAGYQLYAGSPFASSPIDFDASTTGGDGSYAFYTIGRDAVGNLEAAPATADAGTTIDTEGPGSPTITAMPTFSAGTSLLVRWSALDAGDTYRAQVSTSELFGSILQESGWINATETTFSGLADAQIYYCRVQARDGAQNAGAYSPTATTTMDDGAPASGIALLPAVVNASSLNLDWNGYDTVSGLAGIDLYYSRDSGPFTLYPGSPFAANPIAFDATTTGGDGNYAFYARARDTAGNIEAPPATPDAQTRIDTTPPDAPAIAAMQDFTPGPSVLLTWSNQEASGATEYRAEMSTDMDFTSIAATTGWIPGTSWIFAGLEDGTRYFFRAQSRDTAMNESAPSTPQTTTFDDTAPASAVTALPAITTSLTFPVAWTGSDATSGVASADLYYARDGGTYTLYLGGPFAASPIAFDAATTGGQGLYAFYSRARDGVGNREPEPAGPDAQTQIDLSATGSPTLASLPAFTPGTTRKLDWTPGANNATYLAQAATDAGFGAIASQSDWMSATSYTFGGLAHGQTYWFRVKASNSSNAEGAWSATMSSTQDAVAPQSQVATLPATTTSLTFDLAWTGSDATSSVAGVRLFVAKNGGTYNEYDGGPFTTSPIAFDATSFGGDGRYDFYTRGIDAAGNLEAVPATADAGTLIDSTAPAVPAMIAEPGATQGTSNWVSWSATAGAMEYEVECARDAAFTDLVASSSWIALTHYAFDALETGTTYWYRVRARDAAGNMSSFSGSVSSTQTAGHILSAGWNLISFNIDPNDTRIDQVLGSIAGSFSIVRSYEASAFHTYLPGVPIEMNDLQDMDASHGYWIYMTKPDTLAIGGTPANPGTPIDLAAGWNLASYRPATPMAPSAALASIAGNYALARGYETGAGYRTYYPTLPALSDLLDMRTGQGYWLYMTAPDQLVYGGLPKTQSVETSMRGLDLAAQSAAAAVPTVMDLYSTEFTIDGAPAPAGTVLEALDAAGKVQATATVKVDGRLPILHLHGDISITTKDEGFLPGEAFTLRVCDRDLTLTSDAALEWEADVARAAKLEFVATESLLPRTFALAQNAPNPFNPTTTIVYAIPPRTADGAPLASTQVDLRIFDIRGRVVKTLVGTRQAPGRYSVLWNGRDDQGHVVSSGVYLIRFRTEQFTQSRKMLLAK